MGCVCERERGRQADTQIDRQTDVCVGGAVLWEARRGWWISWSWNYRVGHSVWCRGSNPGPHVRAGRT